MTGPLELPLTGRVLRLDPRRRIATVNLPSIGRGRTYRADFAVEPDEPLARVVEWGHGSMGRRTAGAVKAVRSQASGAEADLRIDSDTAWQRLANQDASITIRCLFSHTVGPDPIGGRVQRIDI